MQNWIYNIEQVNSSGELVDVTTSPYILLGRAMAGNQSNVPSADLYPRVHTPLSTAPLKCLVSLLEVVLKHNFINGLLVMAGSVMALHYTDVIKVNSGCPLVIASGPSETGKTTAITSGLSVTGINPAQFF